MMYVAGTLATLTTLTAGLLGLLWTGRRWADRYRQAPTTTDNDTADNNTTAILNAQPADVDEWTTEAELWLRDHTHLNTVEAQLRDSLDDALHRFLAAVRVDAADLLDHPGFVGVRELVGAA